MAQLIYNEQLGQYWNPQTNKLMQFGYAPTSQDEVVTQSQYDQLLGTGGTNEGRWKAMGYTQFAGDPGDEYYGYHPERGWETLSDFRPSPGNALKEFLTMSALALGGAYLGGTAFGTGGAGGGASSGAAEGAAAAGGATGAGAGAGALMPAAVPETAGTLSSWGLAETAPGVFAAPGATGYVGAAGLGAGATGGGTTGTSGGAAGGVAGGASGGGAAGGGLSSFGLEGALSNPAVLGMGAGALLGGLGGGGKAGTIQTEEGIPDWLMPYVKPTLDRYSTDLQNYNVDPYGIAPAAMQEFKNTIGGMYLDPSTNKYLEDYFRLGAERVKGSLSPSFGHMQAFGGHSGYNEALSRGLGDLAVGLYGGAYERERDRQNQMIAAAPAFLGQNTQAAFSPYNSYLSAISGLGKKKEEPYFTNTLGNIFGGAMVGSQFGRAFG